MADPHGLPPSTASTPTPTGGGEEEREEEVPRLECLLLSVAHHWSLRETADRQVELVERHFRQDEMKNSLRKLVEVVGSDCPKVSDRKGGAGKTATRMQAEDVVNTIKKLGDLAKLPRLSVQSDDLPRILPLLGAVSIGDERGVAARLEALELVQRQDMKELRRMVEAVVRSAGQPATRPEAVVTDPLAAARPELVVTSPLTTAAAARVAPVGPAWPNLPSQEAPVGNHPSFFGSRPPVRVAGRQLLVASQDARPRERSISAKRVRTGSAGEYREQPGPRGARKQRARAKGATGTGPDLEGLSDLAGPVEWYIGNTHPSQNEETVKDTLQKYAEHHKVEDFVVEKVSPLTKDLNPRNKSWKIVVPARLKETMEKPDMFPKGWITRAFTFHSGPRRQERVGQERKEQRPRGGPNAGLLVMGHPMEQGEVAAAAATVEGQAA